MDKVKHTCNQYQPLVVGAPRSGFSLLVSVLSHLYAFSGGKPHSARAYIKCVVDNCGWEISKAIKSKFVEHGVSGQLVYNRNFQDPLGGPKWIDPEKPEYACIRKYIGVTGLGDFTLVVRHPKQMLDYHEVVHSHYHPGRWLNDDIYGEYQHFASVREPLDIINSACFSLNALTSEYLQQRWGEESVCEETRNHLALYKLTDLTFFQGLVTALKEYFIEYISCRNAYVEMKWEALIERPAQTISELAKASHIEIDEHIPSAVWNNISFRNLTGFHKHNYREGHARINGWRESLTNSHIDILEQADFRKIYNELGYDFPQHLKTSSYNAYQRKVTGYLDTGRVYNDYKDHDLFEFAFNKSNLDSSRFTRFKSYQWKENTRIERSSLKDESLLFELWNAAEGAVANFNEVLQSVVDKASSSNVPEFSQVKDLPNHLADDLHREWDRIQSFHGIDPPRLLTHINRWSVVAYGNRFYGLPPWLGRVELENIDPPLPPYIVQSDTYADVARFLSHRNRFNDVVTYLLKRPFGPETHAD